MDPKLEKSFQTELTADEITRVKTLAELAKIERHVPLLKSLIRAYREMRYSPMAAIPLEIAFIEELKR